MNDLPDININEVFLELGNLSLLMLFMEIKRTELRTCLERLVKNKHIRPERFLIQVATWRSGELLNGLLWLLLQYRAIQIPWKLGKENADKV